jgi:hypothetical protein
MACVVWDSEKYGMSYNKFKKELDITREDVDWFYSSLPALRKERLWKCIAIRNKKIIAEAEDFDSLAKKLRAEKKDLAKIQFFRVTPEDILRLL